MPTHPTLKLSYFPISARSAPVRVALQYAGIPFEFEQIGFADWATAKTDLKRFPLGDIPVLAVDGVVITETTPIYHYVGQLTGMWPTDPLNSARALEAMMTVEQIFTGMCHGASDCNLLMSIMMEGETQKAARLGPVKDRISFYLSRVNQLIEQGGTGYTAGENVSIVDLWVVFIVKGLGSFPFEHIDPSIAAPFPHLVALVTKVLGDAKLAGIFGSVIKESS
jgi:prostaglandin-H2 D-isomerase / glutathione transferase